MAKKTVSINYQPEWVARLGEILDNKDDEKPEAGTEHHKKGRRDTPTRKKKTRSIKKK